MTLDEQDDQGPLRSRRWGDALGVLGVLALIVGVGSIIGKPTPVRPAPSSTGSVEDTGGEAWGRGQLVASCDMRQLLGDDTQLFAMWEAGNVSLRSDR